MNNPFLKFAKTNQAVSTNPFLKFAKAQPLKQVVQPAPGKSNPWNTPLKNDWTKTQPMSKAGTAVKNPLLRLDIPSGSDNAGSTPAVETKGNVFGPVGEVAKKVWDWKVEEDKKSYSKKLAETVSLMKEPKNQQFYLKIYGVDLAKLSDEQIKQEAVKSLERKDKMMNLAIGATEPLKVVGAVGKALKGVKAIEPLAQEARKYKTAEEFVNSSKNMFEGDKANLGLYPETKKIMDLSGLNSSVKQLKNLDEILDVKFKKPNFIKTNLNTYNGNIEIEISEQKLSNNVSLIIEKGRHKDIYGKIIPSQKYNSYLKIGDFIYTITDGSKSINQSLPSFGEWKKYKGMRPKLFDTMADLSGADILDIRKSKELSDRLTNAIKNDIDSIPIELDRTLNLSFTDKNIADKVAKAWESNNRASHGYLSEKGFFTRELYKNKERLINEAIDDIKKTNSKINYGERDGIIYFDIGNRQISFHLKGNYGEEIPKYNKEWVGKRTNENPLEMSEERYNEFLNFKKDEVFGEEGIKTKSQLTEIWKEANKKTAGGAGEIKTLAKSNRITQELSTQSLGKGKVPQQVLKEGQKGSELLSKQSQALGKLTKTEEVISLKDDIKNLTNRQVNTSKLNISEQGKTLIKQTIEEVKPRIEKAVGKTLTNKEAGELAGKTSNFLQKTIGREQTLQWEAALLNARQKMAHAAETGKVDQDFIDGLVAVKTQGTDIGRKLQSFNIKADPQDNTSMQAIIEAVLDTGAKTDDVLKAAKGVDFTDLKQATDFYRKFVKPTAGEWIDLLRYNSMLSSPLTHVVNIFSNLVNTATVKPVEKALAGGLDFLGSKITGKKRTMFAGEGGEYLKGYFSNVKSATKRFSDVMQGKRVYTNLDVRNIPVAVSGKKGALATTLSYPMRLLDGMDQFFTALAEGGETAALQLRATKGAKVGNIATQAQKKAAYSIYRQGLFDEDQGIVLDAIDQFTRVIMSLRNSKNTLVSTISKFTSPFVQTPMNIFKQGVEYSPLGFSTIKGATNKTEQLAKAIMGSAVYAGAATMLVSNRISGEEPADAKMKAEYRAAGKQPYSLKIGNTWVSFQKLPPVVAFPFAMVAALDDVIKQKKADDNTVSLILSYVAKYSGFLANQSYVKNIGDALAAAQGEEYAISRMISNYPQQLIPFRALTGWLARLSDETQRVADNKAGFVEQQIQWLMTNYPGLSQKVPARMDAQGNPVKNQNRFVNAVSPVRMTSEDVKKAKEFEELLNLKKLNQNETIRSKQITADAESFIESLKKQPTKEAKIKLLQETIKANPEVADKAKAILLEKAKNLTYQDQQVKNLGVENGERARYIINKVKSMKTKEEKVKYLTEMKAKGLISKEVIKQMAEQNK
jgi:hypothetical protein